MRLAVLGAFPFPLPWGSQVFARDQARALRDAGADVTLLCYGRGVGRDPEGLEIRRVPRWASPRALRSGPSPGRPLADAALVATYLRAHRRSPFDVALAHNAEAALAALAARPLLGVPVVYVAHTLFARELASYAAARWSAALDRVGAGLDALLAGRADGVLALTRCAARSLSPSARGRVARIPPGLDPAPAPARERVAQTCARFGVAPGRFAIYCGNLDGYQELDALGAVARDLPLPVLVATHDAGTRARSAHPALRVARVDAVGARALLHGAAVAVLPRRRAGGFPIKLLNYMEAGRAIVVHRDLAGELEHGRSAWLLPRDAGPDALAHAIRRLAADPPRARELGRGAREALLRHHAWPELAGRTLEVARRAREGR